MTRIAFTADLHVDEYGSRRDAATGLNARLVDYLTTLRFVATKAVELECDALVVAGDFTERRHPAPWLVGKIREALDEAPDELILVRGNHDGEIAGESIVTVMGYGLTSRGSDNAFSRPGITWVGRTAIAAIPYLDRHWLRAQSGFEDVPDSLIYQTLAEQFLAIARGLYAEAHEGHVGMEPDGVVLVCHQTLAGAHLSESQQAFLGDQQLVVSVADLEAIGFEGIVAGHLHRHQALSATTLYPGSIERVDFGEEGEAKGFVVADVGPGRFDWQFIETPARAFLTVDAGPDGDELGTLEQFAGAIVRVVNWPADRDPGEVRRLLEKAGAFEITEIRVAPAGDTAIVGGLAETLSAEEALAAYFADDPDAEALVERGRGILAEVGA